MPVVLTFDIGGAPPMDRNRIQSMFERFGWQNLGGSSYRYPRLGAEQPVEDWFNHVVPALMLFRTYITKRNRPLTKFTLDIQSSSGFDPDSNYGHGPMDGGAIQLYPANIAACGEKNLRDWIGGIDFIAGY